MQFNKAQEMVDYIAEKYPTKLGDNDTPLEAAVWFTCMDSARLVSEQMNLREIAGLFYGGLAGAKEDPTSAIQCWLDTFNQRQADLLEEEEELDDIEAILKEHFSPR